LQGLVKEASIVLGSQTKLASRMGINAAIPTFILQGKFKNYVSAEMQLKVKESCEVLLRYRQPMPLAEKQMAHNVLELMTRTRLEKDKKLLLKTYEFITNKH